MSQVVEHLHHHHIVDGKLQPNSLNCFVCGATNVVGLKVRFYMNEDESAVESVVTLTEDYQSYPGIAHGGIVATVLDETMGRAALTTETPDRLLFTGKMEVKYRRSVPLDTPILFRGTVIKDRGRAVEVKGEAILPDGSVAVTTNGLMMPVPDAQLQDMNTDETGWRIYDDEEFEALSEDYR